MQTDGIWSNIFRLGRANPGMSELLRKVPISRDLNDRELKTLETIVHLRTYKAEETVFVESEPGVGMYVINSGGVDVLLNQDSDEPLYLAQLEPGDFFGEMALLGEGLRSATARTRKKSDLIGLFHPDLVEIMNLHPIMGAKITLGLSKTLAERLRFTNNQLREIWAINPR